MKEQPNAYKQSLGYSALFAERETPQDALKYCNEILKTSAKTIPIDHYTAFMVYINTLITHLDNSKREYRSLLETHNTLVSSF